MYPWNWQSISYFQLDQELYQYYMQFNFKGKRLLKRSCKIQCIYECHQWSILDGHYKTLKLPIWGVFGLLLTHRFRILQKNQRSHTTNHTSHIMHHTFHIRKLTICLMYDFFQVRYEIKCDNKSENMRSSGFLIRLMVGSRILRKNKKKIKLKEKKNT